MIEKIKTQWTGIRPIVMHNAAMIDPDNEFVRKIALATAEMKALKKDDFDGKQKIRRKIERWEWEGSMYWDGKQPYIPGDNIHACIVAGARKTKNGKRAESAIVPIDDVPIRTTVRPGASLDEIFERHEFSLRNPVRIPPKTGARIMKVRPMIPTGWVLAFEIEFDNQDLPKKDLTQAMSDAGSLIGIGDWRPKFGRFNVEII